MGADPPCVGVLIPAGGRGERAGPGEPKQLRPIAGVPMLLRAIRPFAGHRAVHSIVVALPPAIASAPPPWLEELRGERLRIVEGGGTRQESVRRALAALPTDCAFVLVHDAARPFVTASEIDAVLAALHGDRGVVLAVPVSDTLKRAAADRRVVETVPRDHLWRAQTPQGFPRAILEAAHRAEAGPTAPVTDDAALVEARGGEVVVVPGRETNLKVTTADDFLLAETMAAR